MTFMPIENSPFGGMLDPNLLKYMQQQRLMSTLGNIGRGLMQAGARGASFGPGVLQGLGQGGQGGGQNDLLNMMRMQELMARTQGRQAKRERGRKQDFAREALAAGDRYDPTNQILWDQPPAPGQEQEAVTPEQRRGLLAQADPAAYGKAMLEQEFAPPPERFETAQSPYGLGGVGQRSSTTGQISGYQKPALPKDRRIVKGADGFNYYADTEERVIPGAEQPPAEQFETVQDPYGRGGVGQRSTTTGQVSGYQKPPPLEKSLEQIAAESEAARLPLDQVAARAAAGRVPLDEVAARANAVRVPLDEVAVRADAARIPLDQVAPRAAAARVPLGEMKARADAGRAPIQPDRQLVEIYDADSPTGTSLVLRSEAAGQPGKPPFGFEMDFDDQGRLVSMSQGRAGAGQTGMEKRTRGDIEKKLVGAREGLSRLRGIAAKSRPEYQEIPARLGVAWTGLKARFGQGGISSEDRKSLTEFADYRRDAISNINLYIKDITGAQMSATETDRLRLAVPDPGEGIFGGDDPITFKAKLGSAIRDLEKASVRYEYYLGQGINDPEEMMRLSPLDTMKTAVNEQTGERLIEIDGQWVPLK